MAYSLLGSMMGEKIIVGPVSKGLKTVIKPFYIDNDAFPTLINAYTWRGQLRRKRGTDFLCRLSRFFNSQSTSYNPVTTVLTLDGSGAGNLITGYNLNVLSPNASILPGSVIITGPIGPIVYTDPTQDGFLTPTGTGGPNTINYATGAILIPAQAGQIITAIFRYFPNLPVMGLEDLILEVNDTARNLSFDTVYSYEISVNFPHDPHDVSFYKNPAADPILYPAYIPKGTAPGTTWTPLKWNGQDYQQFWTVNYSNALWATNGIQIPFDVAGTNIGMQFKPIVTVTIVISGPFTGALGTEGTAILQITNHGLFEGDFIFVNEVVTTIGINFQSGYVTQVIDANNVRVVFPYATLTNNGSGGIAQYLTNSAFPNKDVLRWYDGDPTNTSATAPVFVQGRGWVNFMPPLSEFPYSINNLPAKIYYLIGARMIIPFKDFLLFLGPVIQASTGTPIYLQDTVIFSENGTPYYTTSYTNNPPGVPLKDNPTSPTNNFHPILVPINETAISPAFFEDQTGFGGFVSAGVDGAITTASQNEDVLILGFDNNIQTRLISTGQNIIPFNFYLINSEYGSQSTFSSINFDRYVLTKGERGLVKTAQTFCDRFDINIIDEVFEISEADNGNERICSQRDYDNELVYFTYSAAKLQTNSSTTTRARFPNKSLIYNYREETWGSVLESYTTYGQFRPRDGYTWATIGSVYSSWNVWNQSWDSGKTVVRKPQIIGGNQQGFVITKNNGTGEQESLYIQNISGNTVTSPNHGLNANDFILITDVLGTVSSQVNGKIFSVNTIDLNSFFLNPVIPGGTYLGKGVITRMYVPQIQTKQFPVGWGIARKIRLGPQQYLIETTDNGKITLLIFLSQNSANAFNDSFILPNPNSVNDSLIYSTVLYTCPESTNLGLSPSQVNLQSITGVSQSQIWHRMNTSLIGDTVQIGFTLSDAQMREFLQTQRTFVITGATATNPVILTVDNSLGAGNMIIIKGVLGMGQLNYDGTQFTVYQVIAASSTTLTIDLNGSAFSAYISGGTIIQLSMPNQFAEINIHGFILDVNPSQVLA
jgi:hypothetical protein